MIVEPSENQYIYHLDKYFKELISLFNKDRMTNKIIFSGKKGLGKSTLAYHIINYILSKDEEYSYDQNNLIINKDNKSFKLLQNNSHPNFYLIDVLSEKKNIDIHFFTTDNQPTCFFKGDGDQDNPRIRKESIAND